MAIMFGNGKVKTLAGDKPYIMKTEQFTATDNLGEVPTPAEVTGIISGSIPGWSAKFESPDGKSYDKLNPKFFSSTGEKATQLVKNEKYFCTYDLKASGSVIEISASSFPGTYYVVGDTFARSEASGMDEFFQFIVPKAKVQSENTITLEAEGDPSVFNMNLRVMRPADGKMMKLVKYNLEGGEESAESLNATLIHNHNLTEVAQG